MCNRPKPGQHKATKPQATQKRRDAHPRRSPRNTTYPQTRQHAPSWSAPHRVPDTWGGKLPAARTRTRHILRHQTWSREWERLVRQRTARGGHPCDGPRFNCVAFIARPWFVAKLLFRDGGVTLYPAALVCMCDLICVISCFPLPLPTYLTLAPTLWRRRRRRKEGYSKPSAKATPLGKGSEECLWGAPRLFMRLSELTLPCVRYTKDPRTARPEGISCRPRPHPRGHPRAARRRHPCRRRPRDQQPQPQPQQSRGPLPLPAVAWTSTR